MILAGDIGGTNTRLALFEVESGKVVSREEASFPSRECNGLEVAIRSFLSANRQRPACICLGIAGPVFGGRCHTTNLPWVVDAAKLAEATGIEPVLLLNDLEAVAHSLDGLAADEVVDLQSGVVGAQGNRAVIAAGTGLGEAGLFWNGRTHEPFACEGGHTDFSPRNELEAELLHFLLQQFGHASWERVVSGPGLVNIYQFLRQRHAATASDAVATAIAQGDSAAVISQAALEHRCPVCEQALDLFVALYGAEAGNLALKLMATGGVYIAGGIAAKILPKLLTPLFLESLVSKGRLRTLLEKVPVRVVRTDRAALIGAANYGRHHMRPPIRHTRHSVQRTEESWTAPS